MPRKKDRHLGMTEGYTSIFWRTPDEDVGFWYENLTVSLEDLPEQNQGTRIWPRGKNMPMQKQPVQEVHYGNTVWVNPTMEAKRREECLCLNCGCMKPGEPDHCTIAQKLYAVSVADNVAMAITRCPVWKPKNAS